MRKFIVKTINFLHRVLKVWGGSKTEEIRLSVRSSSNHLQIGELQYVNNRAKYDSSLSTVENSLDILIRSGVHRTSYYSSNVRRNKLSNSTTFDNQPTLFAVKMGKVWEEKIVDLDFPLVRFEWGKVKLFVDSFKSDESHPDAEIYELSTVTIKAKEDRSSLEESEVETSFLAKIDSAMGQGDTVDEAVKEALSNQEKLLQEKLGA